jgi:hypothetical protein
MGANRKLLASVVALGVLASVAAPAGRADPTTEPKSACAGTPADQAKPLADQFYREGRYQSAGECYQAAGDLADANEAFVKAARPNGDGTAKDFEQQGRIAKTLFSGVQQAFRSNH